MPILLILLYLGSNVQVCLQIAESESDKSEKCEWYFHLIWSRDQSSSTLGEMFQGLRL